MAGSALAILSGEAELALGSNRFKKYGIELPRIELLCRVEVKMLWCLSWVKVQYSFELFG